MNGIRQVQGSTGDVRCGLVSPLCSKNFIFNKQLSVPLYEEYRVAKIIMYVPCCNKIIPITICRPNEEPKKNFMMRGG